MDPVEAAASLFGSSDSGSDLDFLTAPEGPNSASESPGPAGNGASDQLLASQDSSSLFDAEENTGAMATLFEPSAGPGSSAYGQEGFQDEAYQPNEVHSYGNEAQTPFTSSASNYTGYDEGWYDETGQWHYYEQHEATPVQRDTGTHAGPVGLSGNNAGGTTSYTSPDLGTQYYAQNTASTYGYQRTHGASSQSTQSTYDPYKPAAPDGHQQTNTHAYAASNVPYDPYKPSDAGPQRLPSSTYEPEHRYAYDPYKPVASSTVFPPSVSTSFVPQPSTFTVNTSFIPSPPSAIDTSKPSAPPYRPSTANAYDPPIPVVKPKKSFTPATFQYQSASHSSNNATSPPPRPARRMSSTPRASSSVPPGPPLSSMVQPPRSSSLSHAGPTNITKRSSSPYDFSPTRHCNPIRSFSPQTYGTPQQHVNGQYISPPHLAPLPEAGEQTTNSSEFFDNTAYESSVSNSDTHITPIGTNTARGENEYSGGNGQEPDLCVSSRQMGDYTGAVEVDPSSKPVSRQVSPSRRATGQGVVSERHVRTSPDVAPHFIGTQRTISPSSDSGRSQQKSVGRSSPLSARARTAFVGQSFSVLDEQTSHHSEPYNFVSRSSLERADSPAAGSVGSLKNHAPNVPPSSYSHEDSYAVGFSGHAVQGNGRSISPNQQNQTVTSTVTPLYDPYKPKPVGPVDLQKFPAEPATKPTSDGYNPINQYTPQPSNYQTSEVRERSMSNLSSLSTSSSISYDRYDPSAQTVNRPEYSPYSANCYVAPPAPPFGAFTNPGRPSLESSHSPPPISGPYAPSPSLLGLNDQLGRTGAKVPVISFGFGGKLVTCFHSPPTLETGFDVALSSRKCTDVHIRTLHKAIPESVLNVTSASYPGPLFGDPGTPVTTLARAATSANAKTKTKKAKVLSYLSERAEELERGLGYLTVGSVDRRRAEGKLTLVRLLRALVEHDGQLYGSPAAESATREAILPRLANTQTTVGANAFLNAPTGAFLATGTFGSGAGHEKPLAEYAVRRSALETLQEFLLRGEKRKAYHYALDEMLWAHAMVISSSIDKEAFKEVVGEFISTELGVKAESHPDAPATNCLGNLRLAYSLYSGQSSTAVQHLLPIKSLQSLQAGPSLTLQPPTPINHMTPLSPNFPPPSVATNISPEILSQWPEYAAMLFSGQMGAESSSALTTLGDYLISNDWVEAAHCCYLLSPQSSPINGIGAPSVRIVLVGSHSPHKNSSFLTDPDAFIFSEVLEYALTLHTPAKGQDPFPGFPHLQPYRLIRAFQLAEMGQVAAAKRYCEAITSTASRPSPYLSQYFSDLLRDLFNRLSGIPELDKSNTLFGGKLAKPSLDNFGGWLEGKLSKFVAGEEGSGSPKRGEHASPDNAAYANAFSRYSNISSTSNSRGGSPAPSLVNNGAAYGTVPGRTASASGFSYSPNIRSVSSMDYERPRSARNTPPPRMSDSSAASRNQPQAVGNYGYSVANGHVGNGTAVHGDEGEKPQGGGWWNAAYGESDNATPTANSFSNTGHQTSESESGGSGFISLMDNYSSFTPSPSAATFTDKNVRDTRASDDFDDDLGLSNSSTKKKKESDEGRDDENRIEKATNSEETLKQDTKPELSSSVSWFSRLFSRPSSTKPAPVKANLGEETSFYYDKELKRWVNKKAGAESLKPAAPPPPPSRAQTTSPSRTALNNTSGPPPPSPMPAPGRPLSAMSSNSLAPPRKNLAPLRSNLIPEEGPAPPASAPPTPAVMTGLSATPPTGRPKSAAKRSARSRYVDVFQQPS